MIRHLKHNEIDKKKWDTCITNAVNKIIYPYSWYLDIVCPSWEGLVKNDYESIMPLTAGKKLGINYLYPPYFAQQLGVFSVKAITKQETENFLNAIPVNYKFIEINLNSHNTFDLDDFKIIKNKNIELSLNAPYSTLYKKFSDDLKRNIKKANKQGVYLKKNISPKEIVTIFRKNVGNKITTLKNSHYKTLLALIELSKQKGFAEIWGGFSKEGNLCAGVVWIIQDTRAIFLFSATNKEAKKNGVMHFLINTFIREHSEKEMTLDFEGSNLPTLARFYRGFGSSENIYLQIRKNNLSKLLHWIKG